MAEALASVLEDFLRSDMIGTGSARILFAKEFAEKLLQSSSTSKFKEASVTIQQTIRNNISTVLRRKNIKKFATKEEHLWKCFQDLRVNTLPNLWYPLLASLRYWTQFYYPILMQFCLKRIFELCIKEALPIKAAMKSVSWNGY